MVQEYATIGLDAPIRDAIKIIHKSKARDSGYKPFGIMVVDEVGRLAGMISMFDILYHVRPSFMNYELDSYAIWDEELEAHLESFAALRVKEVMSMPVLTVSPNDHLMFVIDKMIKNKTRRLPVLEGEKITGIVYLSDVFYNICETLLK